VNPHEKYMNRCLELAANGLGTTYPNPLVGSVIVYKDKIIGEGWHKKSGLPHAEVNALNSVKNKSLLTESTIYVNLEPCSHFGKTPPCSDLIIANKIPNVVIGTVDPNALVAGKGVQKLVDAGVNVTTGILEKKCLELNRRFFTFHDKKRPYVILKWAQSGDGYIAPISNDERKPVWITNDYSRQLVHKWRTEEQSILIGTQTAIDDNPKLDARNWHGNNPVRVVIDRLGKIPDDSHIFDNQNKTIIICQEKLKEDKENLIFEIAKFENLPLEILGILYRHQILSVIIEGGSFTLQSFIDKGLWDEARIFTGNTFLGDGKKAPRLSGNHSTKQDIGGDELLTFRNYD